MKTTDKEARAKIREFLVGNFLLGKNGDSVKDGDSFLESGTLDSTGVLEFVGFLEETWGIRVTDEELLPENFDSVDNLTAYVLRKTA
jgi:acyl carrier protein